MTLCLASFPVSTPSFFSKKKLGVETGNEANDVISQERKGLGTEEDVHLFFYQLFAWSVMSV